MRHQPRLLSHLTPIITSLFFISSCTPKIVFKRDELSRPHRVVVMTEGCLPSSNVTDTTSAVLGATFGLLGGLVGSAFSGAVNMPRATLVKSAVGDWNFAREVEKEFVRSIKIPTSWEIVSASQDLTEEQRGKLKDYVQMITNRTPATTSKDRNEENKQRVVQKERLKTGSEVLQQHNVDLILRLNLDFVGLSGSVGDEDYEVRVIGTLIDTAYPPKVLWQHMSSSEKRPDAKEVRMNYETEKNRPSEEIRGILLERANFVSRTLARDFE